MLAKLEAASDDTSRTMQESIEGKIVDLQSQLRLVRDQRETGVVPQKAVMPSQGGRGGRGSFVVGAEVELLHITRPITRPGAGVEGSPKIAGVLAEVVVEVEVDQGQVPDI